MPDVEAQEVIVPSEDGVRLESKGAHKYGFAVLFVPNPVPVIVAVDPDEDQVPPVEEIDGCA